MPLVGGGQILAQPSEEPGNGAILGQRVERPLQVSLIAGHRGVDLRLQGLDEPLAVGRAELLEEHALFTDLLGQRLGEDAVPRADVSVEQTRQAALVVHERAQPL